MTFIDAQRNEIGAQPICQQSPIAPSSIASALDKRSHSVLITIG